MSETIERSVDGPIGRLWLNRPEKLNPLSVGTLQEIIAAAHWFNEQRDVKVVVIGGRGRAFSAGADIGSFGGGGKITVRDAVDTGRRMAEAVEAMRAVTIARIHGWCVGGAVVLAAACDLRVATDSAKFSIPEIDLGIPLAWGGVPRLVREIGPALTKELVLTCRPFEAAEGKAIGFLNRVVSEEMLDDTVDALTAQLASKASVLLTMTKQHVDAITAQMVGPGRSWSDADGLLTAMNDPECDQARMAYLSQRGRN